jgi:hypothetical protein
MQMPNFIAMDPPKHDQQRKTIAPIVSSDNLANFAPLIRSRAAKILDELPIEEPFDWVERVSVETHRPDARHPVRLPVRGTTQAAVLVRPGRHRHERRDDPRDRSRPSS